MSDAKISIDAVVNDEEIRKLSKSIGEATAKLKDNQKELRKAEKEEGVMSDKAKELRAEITAQKAAISANNAKLKEMAKNLTETGKASDSAARSLKDMVSNKLGFNIEDLTSKMTSSTAILGAMATAAATVGATLVASAREVSAFSNQFINFAGSAEGAMEMYNRFNDVARNMDSSWDEQKVYDMAKGLMRIGVSANDAADIITKCGDAAAHFGQGQEYAQQLADTLAKVRVGGELTQKQLVEIAKAGIDLSDVQDQIKQGGEAAYNALVEKVGQYAGSMQKAKGTSAEMEADCKANLVEISRQAALLVDDFFGFSNMLKSFYEWVIKTSQTVIDKLKSMRSALATSLASADAYSKALAEWDEIYGESFQGDDNDRIRIRAEYASACADIAKEEAEARQESLDVLNKTLPVVQAIAKASTGGGSYGGGTSSAGRTSATKVGTFNLFDKSLLEEALISADSYKTAWGEAFDQIKASQLDQEATFMDGLNQMTSAFVNFGQGLVTGTQSLGDELKNLAQNICNSLLQTLMKFYMQNIVTKFLTMFGGSTTKSGLTSGLGGIGYYNGGVHMATGGAVHGPGSSTSDSVPAMLSNGEYVLSARAVSRLGIANLDRMNHFADGGYVGTGAGAGNIKIELKNESGVEMKAETTGSSFDGESYVIGVVLKAISTNKNGMRSILKGVAAT